MTVETGMTVRTKIPDRVGDDDFATDRSKARRPTGGFQHLKTQPR